MVEDNVVAPFLYFPKENSRDESSRASLVAPPFQPKLSITNVRPQVANFVLQMFS